MVWYGVIIYDVSHDCGVVVEWWRAFCFCEIKEKKGEEKKKKGEKNEQKAVC